MEPRTDSVSFLETSAGNACGWFFALAMLLWLVALFCDVPYLNGVVPAERTAGRTGGAA